MENLAAATVISISTDQVPEMAVHLPPPALIWVHPEQPPVEITVAVNSDGMTPHILDIVYGWVAVVRAKYYQGDGEEKVVLGVVPENGLRYVNSQKASNACCLLQVCVGRSVLIVSCYDTHLPDPLRLLFEDPRTVLASVFTDELEKDMINVFHVDVDNKMQMTDLDRLARSKGYKSIVRNQGPELDTYSEVMGIADAIVSKGKTVPFDYEAIWYELAGGTYDIMEMKWWESEEMERLSPEKIKSGAFLAFLTCWMAVKLRVATTPCPTAKSYRRKHPHPDFSEPEPEPKPRDPRLFSNHPCPWLR